jgi:hypothetical protein
MITRSHPFLPLFELIYPETCYLELRFREVFHSLPTFSSLLQPLDKECYQLVCLEYRLTPHMPLFHIFMVIDWLAFQVILHLELFFCSLISCA